MAGRQFREAPGKYRVLFLQLYRTFVTMTPSVDCEAGGMIDNVRPEPFGEFT